jgi:nicotinamide-nucleotide amidase
MLCEIITIGDEILIGQIVDTNSAWMGQQLNAIGISVNRIVSVSDNHDEIFSAFTEAAERAPIVLITGGLGPTRDDITRKVLCEYFNTEMVMNDNVLQHITSMLASRNISMNPLNRLQAEVPKTCTVLHNPVGTAPGMWFEKEGVVYVSMPGVPFEMKELMTREVMPRLKQKFSLDAIYHKTIMTSGIPESSLAIKISEWELALPSNIKLAYLPAYGCIRLRLSAKGKDYDTLKQQVAEQVEKLKLIISENIFSEEDEQIEAALAKILIDNKLSISVAESCTGGNIAHMITSQPGSSEYFKGGVVAYSNQVKMDVLGVKETTLDQHGAVSRQTVEEMAAGVRALLKSDYALSISGIAGPGGGTNEKPVGTVWVAIAWANNLISKEFMFNDNRDRNIQRSSVSALFFLFQQLRKHKK